MAALTVPQRLSSSYPTPQASAYSRAVARRGGRKQPRPSVGSLLLRAVLVGAILAGGFVLVSILLDNYGRDMLESFGSPDQPLIEPAFVRRLAAWVGIGGGLAFFLNSLVDRR